MSAKTVFRFQIDIEADNWWEAEYAVEEIILNEIGGEGTGDVAKVFKHGELVNGQFVEIHKPSESLLKGLAKKEPGGGT